MRRKLIGRGMQYRVFDAGNVVVKMPTSRRDIQWHLLRSHPSYLLHPSDLRQRAEGLAAFRDTTVAHLAARSYDHRLLGNLRLVGNAIIQDKLTPLGDVLRASNDGAYWVDVYVELILACWRQGFSETTFNFTVNNGVTKKNELVVMDIGEVSFDTAYVRDHVASSFWLKGWSYRTDLDGDLRDIFRDRMAESVTLAVFDELWGSDAEPS